MTADEELEFLAGMESLRSEYSLPWPDGSIERCLIHLRVLWKWNRTINLVGDLSIDSSVRRHYGESLFLAQFVDNQLFRVADFGSGAGFPGIGIASLHAEKRVVLLEARQRRAVFLREACRGLSNVSVVLGEAERYPGSLDALVARAVNPSVVMNMAEARQVPVRLLVSTADAADWSERLGLKGWSCEFTAVPWRTLSAVFVASPTVPA